MTLKRFNATRSAKHTYLAVVIGAVSGVSSSLQAQDYVEDIADKPHNVKKTTISMQPKLTAAQIDWVKLANLPSEERDTLHNSCTGKYVDPLSFTVIDDTQDMDALPLIVEADTSTISGGNKAVLEGDVIVTQGTRSIKAQRMTYDRTIDQALLETDVTIRQPGMLVVGQVATASTVKNYAKFTESSFVLHETHMRGSAESVSHSDGGRILLTNGRITSCEPDSNAWSLQGAELSIDQEQGQGYGRHVQVRIADIPIFYLPYISFPVGDQRKSGFLYPSISSSDDGGIDIAAPYYWNIAPNYDATITPRFISGRGAMLETEFRHLSQQFSQDVNVAFLPNDNGGVDEDVEELIASGEIQEEEGIPHKGQNRWLIQYTQNTVESKQWSLTTDYTKVSDIDYLRDLSTSSFSVNDTTYLNQQIQIDYRFNNWVLDAQLQNYQVLLSDIDSPYRKLPEINLNGEYYLGQHGYIGHVNTELKHQYTYFDHATNESLNGSPIITGQRLVTNYTINNTLENDWGYLKAGVGYKSLNYKLQDIDASDVALNDDTLSFGAAQASIDMSMAFENPNGRFLQTLEPRLYYLYRQFTDQTSLYDADTNGQPLNFDTSVRTFSYDQLYRDSRFSGYDRLDDANRVTLGITSRWFSKTTGTELLSGSIGQITHLSDRRVGLNDVNTQLERTSELAANMTFPVGPLANAYVDLIYNQENKKLDRLSSGINFATHDNRILVNILYSHIAINPEVSESERIDQVDANFFTPLNHEWSLFARANYDFENDQELESFLGLEYDNCCYKFSFLARRWLDSNIANITENNESTFDSGIFFEIQLKGLGGSGAKVQSILEDSIPGYRDR